ncbi:MAG TPA: hypothetical protein VHH11_07195 [Gammaproteobacteria bacterium]|jgi:hypothetical protein|nr:hypothetical protein [Gammaproteobacteria bacterium]
MALADATRGALIRVCRWGALALARGAMRDELVELISLLSDTQKLKVARLLEVAA